MSGLEARVTLVCAPCCWGVDDTIHPHAGSYIEFEDEIDGLAREIEPVEAGFCLDTGHLAYAGMDPAAMLRRYAGRLDYVHFKDIDGSTFARVAARRTPFFEACAEGVMCPIGRGTIDYGGIARVLDEIGYSGYIAIEQERDPRMVGGASGDLAASRAFLRASGF